MRAEEVEALGSLEALRQKWQHDGKHLFFQALCSFHNFRTQALVRGFVCWRYKVPPGRYHRHTGRIRRCYAAIFCMMLISFHSEYGSSFYNYKIQNRISCRYKKRQKKKTRTESARIKNQKCGISKEFRCCRRTDRSCRDRARGSLQRPGSSGLPASGMFLRSLDRVFRDTADSLTDPSGA